MTGASVADVNLRHEDKILAHLAEDETLDEDAVTAKAIVTTADDMPVGVDCVMVDSKSDCHVCRRLASLGFMPGMLITAWVNDSGVRLYKTAGGSVGLSDELARMISVLVRLDDTEPPVTTPAPHGELDSDWHRDPAPVIPKSWIRRKK